MAGKRVAVVTKDGDFGTIDEQFAHEIESTGGRVLTRQEEAERAVDERYDALSPVQKAVGLIGGNPYAHPVASALSEGTFSGLTAGAGPAIARKGIDAVQGKEAGDEYARRLDDTEAASPIAHGIGNVVGMVGGAVLGDELGAARVLPSAGISAAGGAVEHGVERALAGVATKGVVGRAAVTGAKLAARGAAEGAGIGVLEQATSDITHDDPTTGAKLFAAGTHGALFGGAIGGGLGFGGSLASSGIKAVGGRVASAIASRASRAEEAAIAERPPLLEPGGAPPVDEALPARRRFWRDSVEGGALDSAVEPPAKPRRSFGLDKVEGGTLDHTRPPLDVPGAPAEPAPSAAEPVPRVAASPEAPASAAKTAVSDLAAEQAWKAVGGGFGLQSTRFAKQAAKYFPEGTKDLGKIALKYGAIDLGEASASPWQSAKTAAMSGTPDAIAPKLSAARDQVGQRIGEITDASGATIPISDVQKGIATVRNPVARIAGNEHVVNAIDEYERSLLDKLRSPNGEVRVQDLLEQRKGLDDIVYKETRTLDPGRRVAALREVRGEMEDIISDALDRASGRVPGELRAEYKSLKKDYHGLSILSEAAEDSAARASKSATFGFREALAAGQAVASGHIAAAPLLAFGGKIVRERGNAAAAAFLTRAAEQGHVDAVVSAWDRRVSSAAKGVLHEAPEASPKASAPRTRAQADQGRADVRATQDKAQAIVQHIASLRAEPSKLMSQVQAAADIVERSTGRRAAESFTATSMRALAYVASYVPMRERRDPLDPRSVPPLTYDEADRLVRAAGYGTEPGTVLDDFKRGVITPEGLRAADELLPPESYAQFRQELRQHVELKVMRGTELTQSQRLRIDKLLQSPAGADLKPAAIARLQNNLTKKGPSGSSPPAGPTGGGGNPPPAPVDLKVQQTGFDAVEARLAG